MLRPLAAGGALLALLAASSVSVHSAQAAPAAVQPPSADKITVEVVAVNGSGCPRGTADVTAYPDGTGFSVAYSHYTASAGPASDPVDIRKNCQISLRISVPQGFTYAVSQAEYRGYAHLQPGAEGLVQAAYYFQGDPKTTYRKHPLRSPMSDYWKFTDRTEHAELVWAPCGKVRGFNINSELRAYSGSSDSSRNSFVSMDKTDAAVNTKYHFAWKKCPTG